MLTGEDRRVRRGGDRRGGVGGEERCDACRVKNKRSIKLFLECQSHNGWVTLILCAKPIITVHMLCAKQKVQENVVCKQLTLLYDQETIRPLLPTLINMLLTTKC